MLCNQLQRLRLSAEDETIRRDRLNVGEEYIQKTMVNEDVSCQKKKKKKAAICWLCLTALPLFWVQYAHARLNALWKSGLIPWLICVDIPQQIVHRWDIYEHKLPVWVPLYFIPHHLWWSCRLKTLQGLHWGRKPPNDLDVKKINNLLREREFQT